MVSFQCDGCSDVVKKPKLDQHHYRGCGASFTCIDCSKTFQMPADWKGHTSCISEAQKYQKALYMPKSNGGGRERHHQAASQGKFQGGGWNRLPTRWQATGANGTPLGTPTRMSPVMVSPVEEGKKSAPVHSVAKDMGPTPEKPSKAHKERKSEESPTEVDPCPREKLKTKEKKVKEKKDKQKKSTRGETVEITASGVDAHAPSLSHSLDVADSPMLKKSTKRKKVNKHNESTIGESDATAADSRGQTIPGDHEQGNVMEGKKKKKEKHRSNIASETHGDLALSSSNAPLPPLPEKKSKKRKRDTETEIVDDMAEVVSRKTIKKKRASTT